MKELSLDQLEVVGGGRNFFEDLAYAAGYVLGDIVEATVKNPDFGPKW